MCAFKKVNQVYTHKEALAKLQRYCAYQDRCHQEVRQKLYDYGMRGEEIDAVMVELIQDKFLDEERFARSYARGKFRTKGWGRLRIQRELKQRDISDYCRKKAMEEIEAADYEASLRQLLEKTLAKWPQKKPFERKQKAAATAFRKGFESELVWELLKTID